MDLDKSVPWEHQPPTRYEIDEAIGRVQRAVRQTPLLESEPINRILGGRVLFKCENLQVTGSFKARGVWNRLAQLTPAEREAGLICFSSGNHGHALAWAAQKFGCQSVVVMPDDAPSIKIASVKAYGAEVVLYDRQNQDRAQLVDEMALSRGLITVPAYDDRRIIAGAATVAREALRQAKGMASNPSIMIVGCGGGGLAAGCSLAWSHRHIGDFVIVEPDDYNDTGRSLASGRRLANASPPPTICDALMAPRPGKVTFPILANNVTAAITVSDGEALQAMRFAASMLGIVVEPGGVLPLAALLSRKIKPAGRDAIVVMSGANVDGRILSAALSTNLELGDKP